MSRFTPFAVGILLLLGALGVSDCGTTHRPIAATRSSASVDACTLYTLADAQKILGPNARKGTPGKLAASSPLYTVSACSYTSSSGPGSPSFRSTTALVRRAGDSAQGKRDFDSAKKQAQRSQDVAGIGESAYWNSATGQLNVWKGGDWVIISAGRGGPRNLDIAKQVAEVMLQHD